MAAIHDINLTPDGLLHQSTWEVTLGNCLEKVQGDRTNHLYLTVYHGST